MAITRLVQEGHLKVGDGEVWWQDGKPFSESERPKYRTLINTPSLWRYLPGYEEPDDASNGRVAYDRDNIFLRWYEDEKAATYHSYGKIRDKWNKLSRVERTALSRGACDKVGEGKSGYDVVRKGIDNRAFCHANGPSDRENGPDLPRNARAE